MINSIVELEDYKIDIKAETKLTFKANCSYNVFVSNKSKNIEIVLDNNANVNIVFVSSKDVSINVVINNNANLTFNNLIFNEISNITFKSNLKNAANLYNNTLIISKDKKIIVEQDVNHLGRDSFSKVNNVAIAFNDSNIIFTTKGIIKNGIKNCNVNQLTRGLILSESGSVSATPILLIDEFDCKAYHGATIGKLNDDDLFYLMSRGLSKRDAFNIVINGLIKPFIESINEEELEKITKKYQTFFKE